MKAIRATLVVLLACGVTAAPAEPPVALKDFTDGPLLTTATREIAQMNADQLSSFIEYVSICRAFVDPMSNRFHCDVALRRSEIKNSDADAVLRIARVLEVYAHGFAAKQGRARGTGKLQMDGDVNRFRDVFETFQLSASQRYAQLQKGAQQ